MERILREKKAIIDVGGGLRIAGERSNRLDGRNAWILEQIRERNISYKVLDYVADYHPDIVGDIQNLPFADNTQEAIICNAVLEHVEDPIQSAKEMYRVLAPGGYCLVFVPFLYYYHAEKGYYGDYWRFTEDGLRFIFKSFTSITLQNVRGPLETFTRLTPLGRWQIFADLAFVLDKVFGKLGSKQTSGYFVFLQK
ncbi:MAG: class I SAM-dependent methyltransferase [Minisyncoccia bacterium]